jgi:hypothetical protein
MGKENDDAFLEGNKDYDQGKWDSNKSIKAKRANTYNEGPQARM